ncbi:hypothetical protein BGZ99_009489, partial [Dissophora globulifera]
MFAKSKKIVTPLVALFVACMAVEGTSNPPLPQVCRCKIGPLPGSPAPGTVISRSQDACVAVGQANGAVWDATRGGWCQIGTESAHDSYVDVCSNYSQEFQVGTPYNGTLYGVASCGTDVPTPQSCICADPSGVNTTAQTQRACTLINNTGTMVGDNCVVADPEQYAGFNGICPVLYPG